MKRFSLLNSSSIKSYFILYMHFFYNILSHKVSNTVCSKYSEKYVNLKTTKHFTYSSLQANNRKLNSELPEWSLFRRKVSIETTLQKLVPIWSLFAPKSLFFEILGPNNASKQQESCCKFRQTHSNRADLMESAVSAQC